VLELYTGLEQAIWREEQQVPAPAPALSFATARLEALNMELQAAEERRANWSRAGDGGSDDSLRRVVLELVIHRNEARAAEHEDFISSINRQVRRSLFPVLIVTYFLCTRTYVSVEANINGAWRCCIKCSGYVAENM
jgi:hypothetical protein